MDLSPATPASPAGPPSQLLVLLAVEGATIPFIGSLVGPHVFVGMLLIPPVLLKLGSTGYRFARFCAGQPPVPEQGPAGGGDATCWRRAWLLTTLALFGHRPPRC